VRIFLVRHAETDCSAAGRFCGEVDAPLNERGRAMATHLARAYADVPAGAIVASPQRRARQTATPLAEAHGLALTLDPDWREIELGAWDTLTPAEARARDPDRFAAWLEDPVGTAPPGGESAAAVAERAVRGLERLRAEVSGDAFVVAHKGTLRLLLCALLGIDLRAFRHRVGLRPASVSCLEWRSSGPLLHTLNDTEHLPLELRPPLGS